MFGLTISPLLRQIVTAPWRAIKWMLLKRPIRFTRLGLFYILFSLAVGAAAINTGNNLLYLILGILLGFIVVSGILSDSGLWALQAEWSVERALYAGKEALVRADIRKERFPAMGVTVSAHWSGVCSDTTSHVLYWLAPRKIQTFRMAVTPLRRGWLTLASVRYSSRFPFGLFEKFHDFTTDNRWVVFPEVRRLTSEPTSWTGSEGQEAITPTIGSGTVPFQLRNFRTGDSARHIHWRSSAKRQRLMVHDMEDETNRGDRLWVSEWPALSPYEFDRFISFVASAAYTLFLNRQPIGLVTPDLEMPFDRSQTHLFRLYRYLALVDAYAPHVQKRPRPLGSVIDLIAAWREGAK